MVQVLISLAAGLFLYCALTLFLGFVCRGKLTVRKRLDTLGGDTLPSALLADMELGKPFSERVLRPLIKKVTSMLAGLLPRRRNSGGEKLEKLLQQTGWAISADEYTVLQLILMTGCGLLGLTLGLILRKDIVLVVLFFFFGAFAAYAILRYISTSAATRRKAAMEKQLPDMLDLLSVSVAAGLGFERAMLHVVETMNGPLVDEFAVTYREMSLGRSRKDALTLLGERCGIEDLSSVTGALVQAGQLGIPICNVLQSQAAAIRRARRSKVKEKAATVSTKMLLPMVGFIFPVLIIVLLGPSLITVMEQFAL